MPVDDHHAHSASHELVGQHQPRRAGAHDQHVGIHWGLLDRRGRDDENTADTNGQSPRPASSGTRARLILPGSTGPMAKWAAYQACAGDRGGVFPYAIRRASVPRDRRRAFWRISTVARNMMKSGKETGPLMTGSVNP